MCSPGVVSLEFGPGGCSVALVQPGDYLSIPGGEIHRESNPTDVEQTLVIIRTGSGPVVINVDRPGDQGLGAGG